MILYWIYFKIDGDEVCVRKEAVTVSINGLVAENMQA